MSVQPTWKMTCQHFQLLALLLNNLHLLLLIKASFFLLFSLITKKFPEFWDFPANVHA